MDYWEHHENPRDSDSFDLIELAKEVEEAKAFCSLPLHRRLWWEIRGKAHYIFNVDIPVRWAIFRNRWRIRLRCYLK